MLKLRFYSDHDNQPQTILGPIAMNTDVCYLVLTHAMTWVEDDPLAHHHMFICRVVVKTVVGLASVLQLQ